MQRLRPWSLTTKQQYYPTDIVTSNIEEKWRGAGNKRKCLGVFLKLSASLKTNGVN